MAITETFGSWVGQQADGGAPDNPAPRMAASVRAQVAQAVDGLAASGEPEAAPEASGFVLPPRRVSAATAAAEARFAAFLLSEPRFTTQED